MAEFFLLFTFVGAFLGAILGYFARQSIAKRDLKTVEAKIQKKIERAKEEAEEILSQAKEKAEALFKEKEEEIEKRKKEILEKEKLLLKKESFLEKKATDLERREEDFDQKVEKLKKIKKEIEEKEKKVIEDLEKVAKISREKAKEEIFKRLEQDYKKEIFEKMEKLEKEGKEKLEKKAREILATVIQKNALPVVQELTTTTVTLPNEEIKGKIIGKEGRNIRTLENLTGVEILIDETPQTVIISGFDPIRRQTAKLALEKLIQDGRIQPAKIEEKVEEAKKEIQNQIREAGEAAVYELGLIGLDPKLIQLLGRLKFRTSFGQNVLLHSLEVAYLAEALASEIGADPLVCKKAGLLHDIGKAIDQEVEGSHTEIGVKILEKFGIEKEVIEAVKSHHGEYPFQSVEGVLVQVADQISGARPGARKDTVENYLKRLSDLEKIALSFPEVEKAWALQAGREIRVFVRPDEVDDFGAKKLAREIARKIEEELEYPGEIKVTLIRETKVVEYAR
jgi:ribonuclease Y